MTDPATILGRIERLRTLMQERGYDAVVLRNNPDIRWLTGAVRAFDDEVAHTAFVTADGLWLHTDSRYYNTFCERMGANTPWTIDEDIVSHPEWVTARIGEARARVVAVEDTVDLAFFDALNQSLAAASLACLTPRLHGDLADLRMVKDADELVQLQAAQDVTDAAFAHICGFIKPGMTEQAVRVELENYMLSNGADNISFETIIAAGPNGANPHARPGAYVIKEGDMVVMDYGALVGDYHADMTRTVCVGTPSDEQVKVYNIVREAHEACAAAIHPGVIGSDIHNLSVDVITRAGYGDYYKHGLGHGVGLEIHERPNFGRLYHKPVPEGSVMTVEPGIYLPGNFGVRLEDCGVVTADGYKPFTHSPHELTCIPV